VLDQWKKRVPPFQNCWKDSWLSNSANNMDKFKNKNVATWECAISKTNA